MADPQVEIRRAGPEDAAFVAEMLLAACFPPDHELPSIARALTFPHAARWLEPPIGERDVAVVARHLARRAGAAVARRFPAYDPSWGTVAPDVPELAIAVAPDLRGRGVGLALLRGFLEHLAAAGERAVSLTVSARNLSAIRLYRRCEFRELSRDERRLVMLWERGTSRDS